MKCGIGLPILATVVALLSWCASPIMAQKAQGEVRIEARDPNGNSVAGTGVISSELNEFRREFRVDSEGHAALQGLPFGRYFLQFNSEGFASWSGILEVRSEVPVSFRIHVGVAPVTTRIQVSDSETLVDPDRTGVSYAIGKASLNEQIPAQPGRTLTDLVNDQPGWLYEANGVLHPRGSEYDVQYVFDGLPLTQNRSAAFAPAIDAGDVDSMRVLTAGIPAEYGRKLGGIVEVTTNKNPSQGWHGEMGISGGSFDSVAGSARLSYAHAKDRIAFGGQGFRTSRYLDPPVLQNFTNEGRLGGVFASYERDVTDKGRLRLSFSRSTVHMQVPNELIQQNAGQRQDISDGETSGQVYFQYIVSADAVFSAAGSVRDAGATLHSNPNSVPVIVAQDRGYREGYARADFALHRGRHDWKTGVDGVFNSVHEALNYSITDPAQFDPSTLRDFTFPRHRSWDIEQSVYLQDAMHWSNWNFSAGLRLDHYDFTVNEWAVSPRLGASRFFPKWDLLLHSSYDRVFQTPAVENLLLASSPELQVVNSNVLHLPVKPAHANYYEFGFTKAVSGKLRIEANVFRRDFRDYPDDDVLLDTGVAFPISFHNARIFGEEVSLQVPAWERFSGFVSYSNQVGYGQGPVTGGLFLGDEASSGLTNTSRFAVTQDQRNTVRARVRMQTTRKTWFAIRAEYGSGLPVQLDAASVDIPGLLAQFGSQIIARVNFSRGRVAPNFSLGAAAGWEVYRKEQRSLAFEWQGANLTNRVNVLDFAGLFSGTAVAAPRSTAAQLRWQF